MRPRRAMLEFRNSRCLGTSLGVCVCVSGRRSGRQVSACRVCVHCWTRYFYACHATVWTCFVSVCKKRSEKSVRDVTLLPLVLIRDMRVHTYTYMHVRTYTQGFFFGAARKASVGFRPGPGFSGITEHTHSTHS